MKKIIIIVILFFCFISISNAEWTYHSTSRDGTKTYIDFSTIKRNGNYVYWWDMMDLIKPDPQGDLSNKFYTEGDCNLMRTRTLSYAYHKDSMGRGRSKTYTPPDTPEWRYPEPDSIVLDVLKNICNY